MINPRTAHKPPKISYKSGKEHGAFKFQNYVNCSLWGHTPQPVHLWSTPPVHTIFHPICVTCRPCRAENLKIAPKWLMYWHIWCAPGRRKSVMFIFVCFLYAMLWTVTFVNAASPLRRLKSETILILIPLDREWSVDVHQRSALSLRR